MNEPHFEVFPEKTDHDPAAVVAGTESEPSLTGEFGWRFQAANGQITATSGEGFTREEDAEEAIKDFCKALSGMVYESQTDDPSEVVPEIVRVDE